MDLLRRHVIRRQLVRHHQRTHGGDDDDDEDPSKENPGPAGGLCCPCFEFICSSHSAKTTFKHAVSIVLKEVSRKKRYNANICSGLSPLNNIKTDGQSQKSIAAKNSQHHYQHYRGEESNCPLSQRGLSCRDLIKELCRSLSLDRLKILLKVTEEIAKQRAADSSKMACKQKLSCIELPCIEVEASMLSDLGLENLETQVACCLMGYASLQNRRPMPFCCDTTEGKICVNPLHWSLLEEDPETLTTQSSPSSPSSPSSISSSPHQSRRWKSPWCQVVHRSYNQAGSPPTYVHHLWVPINHINSPGRPSAQSLPREDRQLKTDLREGAGHLVVLEQSGSDVYLHNLSKLPLFVCGPNTIDFIKPAVRRLNPNSCTRIYDACKTDEAVSRLESSASLRGTGSLGPVLLDSVLVSFGKGWGETFSRRSILSCPSWMEILLHRKFDDI